MKRILSLAMALVLTVLIAIPVIAEETRDMESVPGELIVSLQEDIDEVLDTRFLDIYEDDFVIKKSLIKTLEDEEIQIDGLCKDFKETVIENMGYVYLVEYSTSKYDTQEKAIEALEQKMEARGLKINQIEPNYIVYALEEVVEDSITIQMHNNQVWNYEMIKAPQAWNITSGSTSVKIAIIDTGIDYNHQSLKNYVSTSLGRNFATSNSSDFMDRNGHGTHVAGTVASYGVVSGVMRQGTLIPVKVLGDNGSGSVYNIIEGVLHAANVGADVINMSLGGGGYVQAFYNACQTAMSKGVIIVAASGNEYASSISYPAAYNGVIAVGAVDSNRTRASFSNYGTGLDLMAPGVNIYSTVPNNRYQTMSGTSMASPHVAGVAGLMRSANRNISVNNVRNILRNTAQYAGNSYYYGYGIVNAYEAVRAAAGL